MAGMAATRPIALMEATLKIYDATLVNRVTAVYVTLDSDASLMRAFALRAQWQH